MRQEDLRARVLIFLSTSGYTVKPEQFVLPPSLPNLENATSPPNLLPCTQNFLSTFPLKALFGVRQGTGLRHQFPPFTDLLPPTATSASPQHCIHFCRRNGNLTMRWGLGRVKEESSTWSKHSNVIMGIQQPFETGEVHWGTVVTLAITAMTLLGIKSKGLGPPIDLCTLAVLTASAILAWLSSMCRLGAFHAVAHWGSGCGVCGNARKTSFIAFVGLTGWATQ